MGDAEKLAGGEKRLRPDFIIVVSVVLLALYGLGIGPAFVLATEYPSLFGNLETYYRPPIWLCENSVIVERFFIWYLQFWESWM